MIDAITFPVTNVSSCVFGGPDPTTLHATTSQLGLDEEALKVQPLTGCVFTVVE